MGGEVFFQERAGANSLSLDEDDGYIMGYVFDWKTKVAQFKMWDSQKLDADPSEIPTPVVTADFSTRVPYGFHGTFVPEGAL